MGDSYRRLVTVLELVRVEAFLPDLHGLPGRPAEDRAALARAFVAKAVFDIPTTRALIERLEFDKTLRRLCGWPWPGEIPSEVPESQDRNHAVHHIADPDTRTRQGRPLRSIT